jgi:hypothetical protein
MLESERWRFEERCGHKETDRFGSPICYRPGIVLLGRSR